MTRRSGRPHGQASDELPDRRGRLRRRLLASAWRGAVLAGIVSATGGRAGMAMSERTHDTIELPAQRLDGDVALEAALLRRRSVREFRPRPLSLAHAAQLLWAGQGVTIGWGGRTAPSAGALYPLELHLVAGAVDGLPAGVYRFQPRTNDLRAAEPRDLRPPLARAALGQAWIATAPAIMVVAAVERRTAGKYGWRAERYVQLEAGHAAQNILLQAAALGLGGTPVGAFDDDNVHSLLALPSEERPLYLLPVGHPA